MSDKNTPRDFFLHIATFATLYFAVIALITLLFNVIDYAFPDELNVYYSYVDPYSGPMRFAIAALIVLVPIFIFLMHTLQKETRVNPERRTIGVRKWLTYVTLFIAGATVIGDLIALLNSFLGGTLANAFLLKVLVLFAIMGSGFAYFFLDVKEYWLSHRAHSQYAGGAVILAVIASIVGGFLIMGSPMTQRELRFDAQQVQDLQMIQSQVVQYWQQNASLPQNLQMIESDVTGFMVPKSPSGRAPYTYERTGELTFELCATFSRTASEDTMTVPEFYGIRGNTTWQYEAGPFCFDRTIDPSIVPLNEKMLIVQ